MVTIGQFLLQIRFEIIRMHTFSGLNVSGGMADGKSVFDHILAFRNGYKRFLVAGLQIDCHIVRRMYCHMLHASTSSNAFLIPCSSMIFRYRSISSSINVRSRPQYCSLSRI